MFQFNFWAATIRLAIKPILKIFLLRGSWESSHKTAAANLIAHRFCFALPRLVFKFPLNPVRTYPSRDGSYPSNSSVFISYLRYSAWRGTGGVGRWVLHAQLCRGTQAFCFASDCSPRNAERYRSSGTFGKQSGKKSSQLQVKKDRIKQKQTAGSCVFPRNNFTASLCFRKSTQMRSCLWICGRSCWSLWKINILKSILNEDSLSVWLHSLADLGSGK